VAHLHDTKAVSKRDSGIKVDVVSVL